MLLGLLIREDAEFEAIQGVDYDIRKRFERQHACIATEVGSTRASYTPCSTETANRSIFEAKNSANISLEEDGRVQSGLLLGEGMEM